MKPKLVQVVSAGKRPKIKRASRNNEKHIQAINNLKQYFVTRRMQRSHFLVAASFVMLASIISFEYASSHVYVVMLDDIEVGTVQNAREFESFVTDLTDRCGDLYGMHIEPGKKVELVREFRPESKPQAEAVQKTIRDEMVLLTDAYMLKVNGMPLAPVSSENAIELLDSSLKMLYSSNSSNIRIFDAHIVEDLTLEPCRVCPEKVHSIDEVLDVILNSGGQESVLQASLLKDRSERSYMSSRQSYSYNEAKLYNGADYEVSPNAQATQMSGKTITYQSMEEVVAVEEIPFSVEYVYCEEMWIVESEVETEGRVGQKEVLYHVTRQNGVVVERTKVSEEILFEPVTQIERHGLAKVPDIGSGQFVWPVEGGGEITPGRGFSEWHTGIDIHADLGANVLASDSGVVWFSGRGGSQGNYIIIYHGSYWSLYLHNDANLVREGDQVEQGEVIGRVGSTGRSSGPHLHFEIRLDDGSGEWHAYYQHKPIDPLRFFNP